MSQPPIADRIYRTCDSEGNGPKRLAEIPSKSSLPLVTCSGFYVPMSYILGSPDRRREFGPKAQPTRFPKWPTMRWERERTGFLAALPRVWELFRGGKKSSNKFFSISTRTWRLWGALIALLKTEGRESRRTRWLSRREWLRDFLGAYKQTFSAVIVVLWLRGKFHTTISELDGTQE